MVAGQMIAVNLRHLHVAQSVHGNDYLTRARYQHARTVNAIGAGIGRLHTARTKPKFVQRHHINTIRLATPRAVARHLGIQRFEVGIGATVAATVDNQIATRLQRERQVHDSRCRGDAASQCDDRAVSRRSVKRNEENQHDPRAPSNRQQRCERSNATPSEPRGQPKRNGEHDRSPPRRQQPDALQRHDRQRREACENLHHESQSIARRRPRQPADQDQRRYELKCVQPRHDAVTSGRWFTARTRRSAL